MEFVVLLIILIVATLTMRGLVTLSEWQKKRKQAIEDFKRDVLSSSLVINLNESFNANIDESKVNVIDHEE